MKKLLAVTTAVAVSGSFAATADAAEHTVKSGDTLWSISKNYGTSVDAIKAENGLKSNLIFPNQLLKVNEEAAQQATTTYQIAYGDTLGKIAAKFNVTVAQLKAWNNLSSDLIIAGKTLNVAGSAHAAAPAVVQSTPVAAPVQQAPVAAPKKVYTAPKATYKAPVQQAPVQQAPVQQAPVQQAPVQQAPVQQAPVQQAPVQQAPVQQAPVQKTTATTQTASSGSGLNWAAMAACESGGRANVIDATGNYHGLYQFDVQTWRSVGGSGLPSQASAAEQTKRAQILYSERGSQPWPVCGARL